MDDMDTLRTRLRKAPYDFLSAVSTSALLKFDKEWHSLCEDVDKASLSLLLTDEDISLVHVVASRLAIWGDVLLKTNDEAAKKTATFMDEMESVFAQLTISNVEPAAHYTSSFRSYRRSHLSSGAAPSYIPAAHSWMLQNIHNPYPSNEIKQRISQDEGRPLRVITDWFKEVRRYVGWVSMCKDNFKGSRALAVQAAKQVFLGLDATSRPSAELVSQLEAIRTRLHDMYSLSSDDGHISDSSDDSFTSFRQAPYTSLRSSSSTPSLVFSTDDEDDHSSSSIPDIPVSLGKRKNSPGDEFGTLKRNRYGILSVADVTRTFVAVHEPVSLSRSTSSRKRRLSRAPDDREDATSKRSSSTHESEPCPSLRVPKRRLSMSDSLPISKRPCLPPAIRPRKQAVSTPLHIAHQTTPDINDWFRTFELPDTSLSVELFSNWDVTVENDVFPYNSLYDDSLQSDSADPLNEMSFSNAFQSSTPLDQSAIDPSILDISSVFTESSVPVSALSPGPITATASSAFDLLDAFLSTVNAQSAEPQSTQLSLSPYADLSLDDSLDIFGDLVDP